MAYSSNGKARWVLERLAERELRAGVLWARAEDAYGVPEAGKMVRHLIPAMAQDGLIERSGATTWRINDLGRDTLETLRAGAPVERGQLRPAEPNVRIFAATGAR